MDIAEIVEGAEDVSRRYAERFGIDRTADWLVLKLQEEIGELTQAHLMWSGQARAKHLGPAELDRRLADEIADVVCHALLLARRRGIDVEAAIDAKWLIRLR